MFDIFFLGKNKDSKNAKYNLLLVFDKGVYIGKVQK